MICQIPPFASRCFRRIAVLLCAAMVSSLAHAAGIPTISGFSPESGPVGSTVEIHGTNFTAPLALQPEAASATLSCHLAPLLGWGAGDRLAGLRRFAVRLRFAQALLQHRDHVNDV
jgi:hypothetical protein